MQDYQNLTIGQIVLAARERSNKWHKDEEQQWSILEWAGAMAGEGGELSEVVSLLVTNTMTSAAIGKTANVAKKILRHDLQMKTGGESRDQLLHELGCEMADVILYMVRLADVAGVNLEEYIKYKFNTVSEKYGFPDRL